MRTLLGLSLVSCLIAASLSCKSKTADVTPGKSTKGKKGSGSSAGADGSDSSSGGSDDGSGSDDSSSGGSGSTSRKSGKALTDLALAQKFAPIVKLAPQELYYPIDPEDFLKEKNQDENFFRSARGKYHEGKQGRTIVNISSDKKVLQYWFFFAKNGCQGTRFRLQIPLPGGVSVPTVPSLPSIPSLPTIKKPFFAPDLKGPVQIMELCNLAIHEGDWENVTIKLKDDQSQVDEVYVSAHGHGNWLKRGAFFFNGDRPIVHAALNSHALYAKDQRFHSEFTANSSDFSPALGVQWLQFGDTVFEHSSVHSDPNDGKGVTEFDSRKALWLGSDLLKTDTGRFTGGWGKQVDAQKVLPPPGTDNEILRKVLEEASKVAFSRVESLKSKSTGGPPPSPWGRADWKSFDRVNEHRLGVTRELIMGPIEGVPFDDYTPLKGLKEFKVKQASVWSNGNDIIKVCFKVSDVDLCHGNNGGNEQTIRLADDEYISEVDTFNMGQSRVSGVKLVSNKGQKIEAGQQSGGNNVHVKAEEGLQILGWYGAQEDVIQSLGPLQGTRD